MAHVIQVATVNTQVGRMLLQPDGFRSLEHEHIDALLLQELFGFNETEITNRLHRYGYRLIAFDRPTGLGIALGIHSRLAVIDDTIRLTILQQKSDTAAYMTRHGIIPEHHLRARGLLSVTLRTASDTEMTVVTTHPTIFIRYKVRREHLRLLQEHLQANYSVTQPLLLGADMNHYPRPGRYDILFRELGQFREVPIDQATWPITGTKYEWLARMASLLSRRPINNFNGQLDTILYRGEHVQHLQTKILPIESDHRVIISDFSLE